MRRLTCPKHIEDPGSKKKPWSIIPFDRRPELKFDLESILACMEDDGFIIERQYRRAYYRSGTCDSQWVLVKNTEGKCLILCMRYDTNFFIHRLFSSLFCDSKLDMSTVSDYAVLYWLVSHHGLTRG